jgi:hypothetical protein
MRNCWERENEVDRGAFIKTLERNEEKMGSVATEFSDLKYIFPVHVLMCVCCSELVVKHS